MAFLNLSFGLGVKEPLSIENDIEGNWFYTMFSSKNRATRFITDQKKLDVILSNPACLKVFALNCDLFSLGKVNSENEFDYLKTKRKNPNYKQTWTQFFWDYMFWTMTGTAYLYKSGGRLLDDNNTVEFLNPAKFVWDSSLLDKMRGLVFTKATYKEITGQYVKYDIGNGRYKYIALSDITPLFDLSNGMTDNFYKGISRIDALYKVISNSEEALDAENINLEFSRKFVVSGKQDMMDVTKVPMSNEEKRDIEESVRGNKSVHANKSQIDIKRFVDNRANLELNKAYDNAYYIIGSMFNIPRDILEAYDHSSSTYENQEKSMVRHIEYSLKPKGKNVTDALETIFDIEDIEIEWNNLSCYQVFEKEKQEVVKLKLENAILAQQNNINIDDLP